MTFVQAWIWIWTTKVCPSPFLSLWLKALPSPDISDLCQRLPQNLHEEDRFLPSLQDSRPFLGCHAKSPANVVWHPKNGCEGDYFLPANNKNMIISQRLVILNADRNDRSICVHFVLPYYEACGFSSFPIFSFPFITLFVKDPSWPSSLQGIGEEHPTV